MDQAYVTVTCIGKGSSGSVYLARSNKIKKLVAIKKIQIDESRRSRCRKSVIREANILRALNHFHIVKCYEWFLEEQGADISMVLEYCNGGTLQDRIASLKQSNSRLDENKILEWTTQIASAVNYIHDRRILHRDLKSENVFLLKSEVVKLGDFGISKEIDHTLDKASTCVGTPCYLSPELCQDIPYNFKSDIWALGCLLFEMCALKPAFDAANLISLFYKIVNGKYSPLPEACSSNLKKLVATILVRDPAQRPTAQQLLDLPDLQRFAHKIRVRSAEPDFESDKMATGKQDSLKNTSEIESLDDLDELLSQTEQEIAKRDSHNKHDAVPNAFNSNRSFSVHRNCGGNYDHFDATSENDPVSGRPQTCPHSAVQRENTCTPTDTIATWSGYGDRGSKRPSAKKKLYDSSDDSDQLSNYDSDSSQEKVTIKKNYSSDDYSSYSDDEDFVNTARTGMTIDEEIPEVIETCEDMKELTIETEKSPNILSLSSSVSTSRNLPGSVWLQSKRAQVLRQKEIPSFSMSTKPQTNNHVRSSYPGTSTNYSHVKKEHSKPDNNFTKTRLADRKDKLPGSSWLKKGSRSNTEEIVLGVPVEKETVRKHRELPGSAWLVNDDGPESHRSTYDYPDDFEEYDDDFDQDGDDELEARTTSKSSKLKVKQDCIASIGQPLFNHLEDLFSKGFSIGEAYEKCKKKVDFETVETCYLLST